MTSANVDTLLSLVSDPPILRQIGWIVTGRRTGTRYTVCLRCSGHARGAGATDWAPLYNDIPVHECRRCREPIEVDEVDAECGRCGRPRRACPESMTDAELDALQSRIGGAE